MSTPPSESFFQEILGRWLALLGVATGIAQFAAMPWPLAVRITIFVLLAFAALSIAAYLLLRRGKPQKSSADTVPVPVQPSVFPWSEETLVGRRVVKVASKSKKVSICELGKDGSLREQWLPQGPHQAFSSEEAWSGHWTFGNEGLRVVVRGYNLLLSPNLTGAWTGLEQYGPESEPFVGAVVDPGPLVGGESWTGLKIAENGARRIITASGDGRITETDPFEAGSNWTGRWSVVGDRLHIDMEDRWFLTAEPWKPGILLGTEQSDEGQIGYAVVRALIEPS